MNFSTSIQFIFILTLIEVYVFADTDCKFKGNAPKNDDRFNKLKGKTFTYTDNNSPEKYEYTFGVCTPADPTDVSRQDAGVLQAKPGTDEKAPEIKVIGKYTDADFREGMDWLMLEYHKGDKYHNHCNSTNRMAVIMMTCQPGEEGSLKLLEESNDKTDSCFYMFELFTKDACSPKSNGLSVGSIIVIVVFSLVAVYLLFGFLFQRFVKGAQGLEQIPNYTFWREAGNLSADGCDLVFRSHSASESRQYRGITGDTMNQEIPKETREGHDDHLLSM